MIDKQMQEILDRMRNKLILVIDEGSQVSNEDALNLLTIIGEIVDRVENLEELSKHTNDMVLMLKVLANANFSKGITDEINKLINKAEVR